MYNDNLTTNQNYTRLIDATRAPDCIVFITAPDDWFRAAVGRRQFEIRNDGVTYLVEYDKYFEQETVLEQKTLSEDDFDTIKDIYEQHQEKYGKHW